MSNVISRNNARLELLKIRRRVEELKLALDRNDKQSIINLRLYLMLTKFERVYLYLCTKQGYKAFDLYFGKGGNQSVSCYDTTFRNDCVLFSVNDETKAKALLIWLKQTNTSVRMALPVEKNNWRFLIPRTGNVPSFFNKLRR